MPTVELISDAECPNVDDARTQLNRAFAEAGLSPLWTEWRSDDVTSPAHVRGYGSPTILVDGRDVANGAPGVAACCRVYAREDGSLRGVPDVEVIAMALRAARA